MLTKSILIAAAMALVATAGSAVAGERFSTLYGVTAEAMDATAMGATVGAVGVKIRNTGFASCNGDSCSSDGYTGVNTASPRAVTMNPKSTG